MEPLLDPGGELVIPRMSVVVSLTATCMLVLLSSALSTDGAGATPLESGDELTRVIVEGAGQTFDKAREDAWRNAVVQVVGAMIDSETLVKNERLVNDEVLSYSSGYVQRSSVLSQEVRDGLSRVRIEAWVKKTELRQKLTAIQVLGISVDGASLAAQIRTRDRQAKDALASVDNALEPFYRAKYIRIVSVTQGALELRGDSAEISYVVELAIDDQVFQQSKQRLLSVLKGVATTANINPYGPLATRKENAFLDVVRRESLRALGGYYRQDGWHWNYRDDWPMRILIQDRSWTAIYELAPGTFPRDGLLRLFLESGVKARVQLHDAQGSQVAASKWTCFLRQEDLAVQFTQQADCVGERGSVSPKDIASRFGTTCSHWEGQGCAFFVGLTNLVNMGGWDENRQRMSRDAMGFADVPLSVEMRVVLPTNLAERVVRAEAEVVPIPDLE